MPVTPTEPMFVARNLCWDLEGDGPKTTFWVNATTFKYALGLRPRAAEDEKKAQTIARKNWKLLQFIAREALATDQIAKTDSSKGWQIHHTLDDRVFRHLFEKHESLLVR